MGTLADATLTRIETLSANEALLQSRLGECVNAMRYAATVIDAADFPAIAGHIRNVAVRAEAALHTVRTSIEARHASHDAGQAKP